MPREPHHRAHDPKLEDSQRRALNHRQRWSSILKSVEIRSTRSLLCHLIEQPDDSRTLIAQIYRTLSKD
jgi:hypothetical protein